MNPNPRVPRGRHPAGPVTPPPRASGGRQLQRRLATLAPDPQRGLWEAARSLGHTEALRRGLWPDNLDRRPAASSHPTWAQGPFPEVNTNQGLGPFARTPQDLETPLAERRGRWSPPPWERGARGPPTHTPAQRQSLRPRLLSWLASPTTGQSVDQSNYILLFQTAGRNPTTSLGTGRTPEGEASGPCALVIRAMGSQCPTDWDCRGQAALRGGGECPAGGGEAWLLDGAPAIKSLWCQDHSTEGSV